MKSTGASRAQTTDSLTIPDRADTEPVETALTGSLMDRPDSPYTDHVDDSVLQISSAGHWFLEGWIGDHSVEFLVDSESSVTAVFSQLATARYHLIRRPYSTAPYILQVVVL